MNVPRIRWPSAGRPAYVRVRASCVTLCWLGRVQLNHPTAASGTPSHLYAKPKSALITPILSTTMADSFADLWNSSAPLKPSEPARKLGASPAPSSGAPRPKYDAFAMLTASGSSSSSSRSLTPSSKPAVVTQKSNGGVATTTSGDAFGDLLSGSLASGSSSSKLTIAEKAAKARAQAIQHPPAPLHNSTAWAGLDSLAGATSLSSPQTSKPKSSVIDDDWPFDSSASSTYVEPASALKPSTDDWGLGDFVSRPKPSSEAGPESSSQGKTLWDLDDFTSSERDQGITPSVQDFAPPRSGTPGDFDFGDRENALLDEDSGSDNDILGDLSRPVQERPAASPLLQVCAVSPTGQTYTDVLTLVFTGCHTLTQATLPSTPSYRPNRRNGLFPYSGPSRSRLHGVGS
jgi:hypothetical protein